MAGCLTFVRTADLGGAGYLRIGKLVLRDRNSHVQGIDIMFKQYRNPAMATGRALVIFAWLTASSISAAPALADAQASAEVLTVSTVSAVAVGSTAPSVNTARPADAQVLSATTSGLLCTLGLVCLIVVRRRREQTPE